MKSKKKQEFCLPPRPEEEAVRELAAGERCCPYCGTLLHTAERLCPFCARELPWQLKEVVVQ